MSEKVVKKPSPWVEHIKSFAKKQGITYAQAMRHDDLKKDYIKAEPTKRITKKELKPANIIVVYDKNKEPVQIKEKKQRKPAMKSSGPAVSVPLEIIEDNPKVKKFKTVKQKAVEAPAPM
jgi:hypothetical protein